ncbi:hypothetical protein FCN80_24575 [Martelella alba]|uniref:Uncharacterized protein n=1 Tax=Martelella alba TaxID=2590451 RepID=A0ABY2SDK6_9HYPH|nr:hypothetical protein FCN80_24575 [Martelella alba]
MQPWQPGARLLTEFDLKIGQLSFSVRKKQLNEQHIDAACQEADRLMYAMTRGKTNAKPVTHRRRTARGDGGGQD